MKRHLIWIVTGAAALCVTVPAYAAVQSGGSPDDDGVPGDVRGNCDEAEHANDPECVSVGAPGSTIGPVVITVPSTVAATTPATIPVTTPSSAPATTPGSIPGNSVPGSSVPGTAVGGSDNSVPGDSTSSNTAPSNSLPGDISGPCDEAEHVNDPRCTGAGTDDHVSDNSGHGNSDDRDDDRSGHGRGGDDSDDGDSDDSGHSDD